MKPNPNAVAYAGRAAPSRMRRKFRRCGIVWPADRELIVPAEKLTAAQREFLLASDPRLLIVREILPSDETGTMELDQSQIMTTGETSPRQRGPGRKPKG